MSLRLILFISVIFVSSVPVLLLSQPLFGRPSLSQMGLGFVDTIVHVALILTGFYMAITGWKLVTNLPFNETDKLFTTCYMCLTLVLFLCLMLFAIWIYHPLFLFSSITTCLNYLTLLLKVK
jgi:hypothetical protein